MESYASNEPRIGIVKTAMGACAQFAVFTMPMRGYAFVTFYLAIASHSLIDQSPTPAMPPPNKKEQYYTRDLYIRSISSHEIMRFRGRLHRYTINAV